MSDLEFAAVLPSLIVAGGACLMVVCFVLGVLTNYRNLIYTLSLVLATGASVKHAQWNTRVLHDSLFIDPFGAFYSVALLLGALFCAFLTFGQLKRQEVKPSLEADVLQLFAVAGGLLMIQASNLILLFVGFELLSVCVYVLCGAALHKRASAESALKYFMMGAFSSAFLLYGMALVYGATGSLGYYEIATRADVSNTLLLIGIALMIFGFAFKVSLAPFHIWTPDVYQGAPSSITAFMAVVVKIAAFGGFIRIFSVAFQGVTDLWINLIWLLAVVSMTVGNVMAIQQKSIKRMLAYSSIAHAGYMMMGFLVFGGDGAQAATYYLIAYSFMTIASFGCVVLVSGGTHYQYEADSLESFKGIGWTRPLTALSMTISMFALAGMPPLIGFFGKLYLFTSSISAGFTGLVIVAAVNSVISLYYYLKVIVVMYFQDAEGETVTAQVGDVNENFFPGLAITGATLGVVALGIYSQPLLEAVNRAFQ
jgi:NADH-quinone oxidoreductase subunit N